MANLWRAVQPVTWPDRGDTPGAWRQALIGLMFEGDGLPTDRADSYSVAANPITPPANCSQIDVATTSAPQGNSSVHWVMHPSVPLVPTRFMFYCAGHDQDPYGVDGGGKDVCDHFLAKGFFVVTGSMPLMGANAATFVSAFTGHTIALTSPPHDGMVSDCITDAHRDSTRSFIEPYYRMTTELVERFAPGHLYSTGPSGGGWTCHLHAAVDTRIERSYPTAGSVPYEVGIGTDSQYDLESKPTIIRCTAVETALGSWRMIYAMGAWPGRRVLACYNSQDPVAFPWEPDGREALYEAFEADVQAILGAGGTYSIQYTVASVHSVVPSLPAIDADLGV